MERKKLEDVTNFNLEFQQVFLIGTDEGNGNMYALEDADFGHVKKALTDTIQVVAVEAVSAFFEGTKEHAALGDYLTTVMETAVVHIKAAKKAAAEGCTYDKFNSSYINK